MTSPAKFWLENLVPMATITATSENGENLADNLKTWRSYLIWEATSGDEQTLKFVFNENVAPEACLIYGSNLSGKTLTVAYSDNDLDWTTVGTLNVNARGSGYLNISTAGEHKYWKIIIPPVSVPAQIAIVYLGSEIEAPTYFEVGSFDPLAYSVEARALWSLGGKRLGTTEKIRKRNWTLSFTQFPTAWVDTYFERFMDAEAMLWCWEPDEYISDIFLAFIVPDQKRTAPFSGPGRRDMVIELEGEYA